MNYNSPKDDPWAPGIRSIDVPTRDECDNHGPQEYHGSQAEDPFEVFAREVAAALANDNNEDWEGWPEAGPPTDIDTRKFTITLFKDKAAVKKWLIETTLPQLVDVIERWTAANKMQLPWLELAEFGDIASNAKCLRWNENVRAITGIEGEHDAGTMTFDEALAILHKAGLRCILYTSPSYVPGIKERWRALVPTSRNLPPETRAKLVARLNGLLDGKLTGESFTLSQAYLFGSVAHNPAHRVEVLDGDFLDLRDDLYAGSIFKDGSKIGGPSPLRYGETGQPTPGKTNDAGDQQPQHDAPDDSRSGPVDREKIEFALATF